MADEQFETLREMLADVLRRLERLERQRLAPKPTRAGDLVFVDYVMRVTGLKRVTILQGKAGTGEIPLQGKRPKCWLKGDVDRWQRQRASALRSPKEKALQWLEKRRA